jgi:hypothetical protein
VLYLPENLKSLGEGAFAGSKLSSIAIGSGVAIENDTSLGDYGASFRSHYSNNVSQAGVYLYNSTSGQWRGPFLE